jgi:hypothetical protein
MPTRTAGITRDRTPSRPDCDRRSKPVYAQGQEQRDERHDADGWLYRLELVDCGKGATGRCRKCGNGPGHGPYWYRYRWYEGKMHKRYVGKNLPVRSSQGRPERSKTEAIQVRRRSSSSDKQRSR